MSKNSIRDDLTTELRQALLNKNTESVYKLFQQGANLVDFTIIGISNIKGYWSRDVERSAQTFISMNPGVYYLPIDLIEHVKNDNFIKFFSGLINPGGNDSFPVDRSFNLSDLDTKKMLYNENLYQTIIHQSSMFHIPYLGICSGSQHLVLYNKGFLKKVPGYVGGEHQAHFIHGTIPYFMMLNLQEQQQALKECIFPEVSFSIFTRHNFAAEKDKLAELKLGAVSEEGVVEALSKGTTQIGVQFHPENYYFDTIQPINRQKQFLDNFFNLAIRHNQILKNALENNISEQEMYEQLNAYDQEILLGLETCTNINSIDTYQKNSLIFDDQIFSQ